MAIYKITGLVNDSCTVYIIQDEEYRGKSLVSAGTYEIIFESDSSGPITAVAENSQGTIVGFGDITPIDATSETPTLSTLFTGALTQTGQTTSYATGDDGDLEQGLAVNFQRVTIAGGEVTKDNNTGLMWVSDPEGAGCNNGTGGTWISMLTFANNLTFAGFSDWRMPNAKEMMSIMSFEAVSGYYTWPAYFGRVPTWPYFPDRKDFWSSTTNMPSNTQAFVFFVDGSQGIMQEYNKTYNFPLVRPVRDM